MFASGFGDQLVDRNQKVIRFRLPVPARLLRVMAGVRGLGEPGAIQELLRVALVAQKQQILAQSRGLG